MLSHDGSFSVVESLVENPNDQALVRISHFGHKDPILCTPEHPILVWTTREVHTLIEGDGADPFNGFVWLAAKDIHPTDFIVTAAPLERRERRVHDLMEHVGTGEYEEVDGLFCKVNTDLKHRNKQRHHMRFVSVNRYVEESYDLGLILGWYVAEGHISKRSGPEARRRPTASTSRSAHTNSSTSRSWRRRSSVCSRPISPSTKVCRTSRCAWCATARWWLRSSCPWLARDTT